MFSVPNIYPKNKLILLSSHAFDKCSHSNAVIRDMLNANLLLLKEGLVNGKICKLFLKDIFDCHILMIVIKRTVQLKYLMLD